MNINIDDKTGKVTAFPETSLTPLEASSVPRQEAAHLEEKGKIIDKNLVAGLVKKSNRILISISTHRFPLDIFPDTLNVEEGRLTIINRSFFLSSQVHSVDIKDISNIFVNTAPFYAQLVIISKTFTKNEIRIKYLWKDEAVMIRRIIEGLRTFQSKQVDTSVFSVKDLIAKLKELSTTDIVL
ncbi:MAG: hypothetical protein UW68_C0008G0014 [Candidatus Collierbacteria bacterium GW2011_GWB1_44_6]|uniref:YokE-like PH domain-containing protein n=2 Tax=Candidatus Collieribacteriota TaxID=1752725 RepID=A0A0G1JQ15_9BACT|nr:MAG: hypothetical protein UV68_C0001G0067 [Candidatus Collierbacteria bacterium GW2011_GWC2_43_12]KKT73485.1 MAG: hypothetical protein UW68_C0008G0014 [Candidatus Collierbacteria bacterium GW2011_GWB1_44_6]KKT83865.1 MAG: hypothetical protein UW80_C0005G0013 [Microgenomates group bacterium GW2011_GWC1_44_9]